MSGLMKAVQVTAPASMYKTSSSGPVSNSSLPDATKGVNKGVNKAKLQDDSNVDRKVKSILGGLRSRFFSASSKMRDMFVEWDVDGSGTIDPNELGNALGALGYQVTHDEAKAVVSAFDDNGDGVIQYEDFVSLLCGNEGEGHSVTAIGHDLAFTEPNARDKADPNFAGKVLTWCGKTQRNPQGVNDILNQRRAGIIDIADGRGGDPLKESVHLSRQRAIEERRREFIKNVTGKHVSHYVAGLAGDATLIERTGYDVGADLIGRDTSSSSTLDGEGGGGGGIQQIVEDGGALMGTQKSHVSSALSSSAAHQPDAMMSVFLGPASDAASTRPLPPLNTLREQPAILDGASNQNERNKNAWKPLQLPITTGVDLSLTARAKVPKQTWARDTGPMVIIDAEADPLTAAPDTGKGTVVTGPIGGVYRTKDSFKLRVIKEVDKLRRTGKGVLEDVLGPSMGARARNDSPPPIINRNAFTTRAVDLSDKTLANLYTPMRSAKREDLHSKRLEEYMLRTGRQTTNFSDTISTASSRDERRQGISSRENGGGGGGVDETGEATTTANAMRAARLAKLERLGLSKSNVSGADTDGVAASGHSHVMERLVNVNDLAVRLQRIEGDRTTFLIAPPPNVLTSHSAEDQGWHYASAARIAQTGRRVPEQYFSSLSLADKMSNIREQTMDYTARVESNQQAERLARASRDAARIASKQRQYSNYLASIKLQTDKNEAMHVIAVEGGAVDDIHKRGHLNHSERHPRGRSGADSFNSLVNSTTTW